jgi:hypothetical protein
MLQDLVDVAPAAPARARLPHAAIATVLFLTAGLWIIGLITSLYFNTVLARIGDFSSEPLISYWIWGFRALFGPVILVLMGWLFLTPIILACGWLWAGIRHLIARAAPLRPIRFRVARSFAQIPPNTVCQMVVAVQGIVVAVWFWRFSGFLETVTGSIATADLETFAPLRDGSPERRLFAVTAWIAVLAMSAVWFALLRRYRDVTRDGPSIMTMSAAASLVILLVLAYVIPYRIVFQNKAQRVRFDAVRCYEIGTRQADSLLFCPGAPPPRNRVVSNADPRLERTDIIESIFVLE